MKYSLALLTVGATAVAPPKIALDLAALHNAYKLAKPVYRAHDVHKGVKSRQDWTEKCAAGRQTTTKTCPFPVAQAYDHQDKSVNVVTRVFLVDQDGKTKNTEVKKVDFTKRSTYLFKYDATDVAGNHAEQVVFALILDDTKAPVINMCGKSAETWEAATTKRLCTSSTAWDNIDQSLTRSIQHKIEQIRNKKTFVIAKNVLIKKARTVIDTKTVGRFLVTFSVRDNAGAYGANPLLKGNFAYTRKAILVQDTTPPKITIHGSIPVKSHECSKVYKDTGATAKDTLDGVVTVSTKSSVNIRKVGDYSVKYNAKDKAGNNAVRKTRGVFVRDTTKPWIKLVGEKAMVHYSEDPFVEPGVAYGDSCDKQLKSHSIKWNKKFNDRKLGTYTRTYTVKDASDNTQSARRKYTVVDNKIPIIALVGKSIQTFEATRDAEYSDRGANCQDYVDGILNHAVESSGDVVNFRIPGTYKVQYNCQDLSGNAALPVGRTVIVRDTTCPKVTLKGENINYIEAGFPYLDAGATATDTLDGDITKKVFTDGDTVNTAKAFYSRRSCKDIKASYQNANTGTYYITTYAKGAYKRVLVWCDMKHSATYFTCRNCKRVNSAYGKQQGSCAAQGLRMATFKNSVVRAAAVKKFGKVYFSKGSTDDYLCSNNAQGDNGAVTRSTKHGQITRSESGKYVIFFHVADKAKNAECKTKKRTVIVKDTLPPVITLHLQKKLIHQSNGKQKGLGGQSNPAGTKTNPFIRDWKNGALVKNSFMAESSPVNGWVIGAVASAVAGVALLGFSAKQTNQVPV